MADVIEYGRLVWDDPELGRTILQPGVMCTETALYVVNWSVLAATPLREALQEWLRFHGIDPEDVVAHHPGGEAILVRNVEERCVEYLVFLRDRDGHRFVYPNPDGTSSDLAAMAARRAQGETPPMPWPPEVWA